MYDHPFHNGNPYHGYTNPYEWIHDKFLLWESDTHVFAMAHQTQKSEEIKQTPKHNRKTQRRRKAEKRKQTSRQAKKQQKAEKQKDKKSKKKG